MPRRLPAGASHFSGGVAVYPERGPRTAERVYSSEYAGFISRRQASLWHESRVGQARNPEKREGVIRSQVGQRIATTRGRVSPRQLRARLGRMNPDAVVAVGLRVDRYGQRGVQWVSRLMTASEGLRRLEGVESPNDLPGALYDSPELVYVGQAQVRIVRE